MRCFEAVVLFASLIAYSPPGRDWECSLVWFFHVLCYNVYQIIPVCVVHLQTASKTRQIEVDEFQNVSISERFMIFWAASVRAVCLTKCSSSFPAHKTEIPEGHPFSQYFSAAVGKATRTGLGVTNDLSWKCYKCEHTHALKNSEHSSSWNGRRKNNHSTSYQPYSEYSLCNGTKPHVFMTEWCSWSGWTSSIDGSGGGCPAVPPYSPACSLHQAVSWGQATAPLTPSYSSSLVNSGQYSFV